ncbi:unnamed protein product, partial [Amoebophrya sp. A25]
GNPGLAAAGALLSLGSLSSSGGGGGHNPLGNPGGQGHNLFLGERNPGSGVAINGASSTTPTLLPSGAHLHQEQQDLSAAFQLHPNPNPGTNPNPGAQHSSGSYQQMSSTTSINYTSTTPASC